jgi:transcription elongation factor Elf1
MGRIPTVNNYEPIPKCKWCGSKTVRQGRKDNAKDKVFKFLCTVCIKETSIHVPKTLEELQVVQDLIKAKQGRDERVEREEHEAIDRLAEKMKHLSPEEQASIDRISAELNSEVG